MNTNKAVLEVSIQVKGNFPNPKELVQRHKIVDSLTRQGVGKCVDEGGGFGAMDFVFLVDEAQAAQPLIEAAIAEHAPGAVFTIQTESADTYAEEIEEKESLEERPHSQMTFTKKTIQYTSGLLYLLSLALPCVATFRVDSTNTKPPLGFWSYSPDSDATPGLLLLVMGWLPMVVLAFGWLANPCYGYGMYLYQRNNGQGALKCFLAALVFALATFIHTAVPAVYGINETSPRLLHLMVGFYVWCASMLVGLVGAWQLARRPIPPIRPRPPLEGASPVAVESPGDSPADTAPPSEST